MATLLWCQETALASFVNQLMDGHVKYALGGKVGDLSKPPSQVTEIDCSGFVRYVMYQVFHIRTHAGGSWWQNKHFEEGGFEQVDYATEASKTDNCLRLGYYPGVRKNGERIKIGHIWFVLNGETIESYSGGVKHGPGRRAWNTPGLKSSVKKCYKVATVVPASFNVWYTCFEHASVPELWE